MTKMTLLMGIGTRPPLSLLSLIHFVTTANGEANGRLNREAFPDNFRQMLLFLLIKIFLLKHVSSNKPKKYF